MQHHKQPFEQCLTYSMLRSCSLSQIVYWGAYEQVPALKLLLKASAVVTSSQHHCQRTHSFQSKARTEESSHLPHSKKEGKGRREERRLNLVTYWNTEKTHRLHVERSLSSQSWGALLPVSTSSFTRAFSLSRTHKEAYWRSVWTAKPKCISGLMKVQFIRIRIRASIT